MQPSSYPQPPGFWPFSQDQGKDAKAIMEETQTDCLTEGQIWAAHLSAAAEAHIANCEECRVKRTSYLG